MAAFAPGRTAEVGNGTNVLAQVPELKSFIESKEKQARKDSDSTGEVLPDKAWDYFKAARTGDWAKAKEIWDSSLSQRAGGKVCTTAAGAPVLEVLLAMEQFAGPNCKYAVAVGRGIIEEIPPGAIYFGGSGPGTGNCPLHVSRRWRSFFTLTQNALADNTYLAYLRRMYGSKISIPSKEDSDQAFQEYLDDAQKRLKHDKTRPLEPRQMKPGEDVTVVENKVQVSGQVAVMQINGALARMIFEKNFDREFYIEESFPLEWMYSHLSPQGFIMKINREPLATFSDDIIRDDHQFWSGQFRTLLGDWLSYETSVKDVCSFVEKVYVNKDLQGFRGDPAYTKVDQACRTISKLRSSIGGLYAWNLNHVKAAPEKARFSKEAEFAFKQAYALCPYSPEALYRFVSLLVAQKRLDDALTLSETSCKVDPTNNQCRSLQQQLERMKKSK